MKKKSINNIILISLSIILVLSCININIFNELNYYLDKYNQYLHENLELSDYTPFIEGSGEDINITLHQSLFNTTSKQFTNLDNANTFIQACPADASFNSSYVDITVDNIYAPNKNLVVEGDILTNAEVIDKANNHYISFEAKGIGYIKNISIFLRNEDAIQANYSIYLYNATLLGNSILPGSLVYGIPIVINEPINTPTNQWLWYNFTCEPTSLYDSSQTYNNTFFLRLFAKDLGFFDCGGASDAFGTDQVNESIVLDSSYNLVLFAGETIDVGLKVGLAPYIYPSNTSLNIEVDNINSGVQDFTNQPAATSFKVVGDGYLENVSIFGRNFDGSFDAVVNVYLYNSTWNSFTKKNEPEKLSEMLLDTITMPIGGANKWHNISHQHEFLNNSKTANNTWFIGLAEFASGDGRWFYLDDLDYGFGTDNNNETISYEFTGSWNLISNPSSGCPSVDLKLKVELSPLENVPRPENIGLKINNTAVIGFSDIYGSGYWSSKDVYSSFSGQLEFELSADWWDVSCKITKVQINYTKTDLKANSLYKVSGSEQDVLWNVSRISGLNFFDSKLSDYRINFTIPSNWDNVNVFNGGINKTEDLSLSSGKNGYVIVKVSNAGNGTYWYLTASSENMLEFIETYIDSTLTNVVNYADLVHFNATFKEELAENNGIIKLNVYSPAKINNKLNFSSSNSTFNSGSEFYLGIWELSDTVVEYGEFRVQVLWNNDTAAGFIEKILTIMGQTDLTLVAPDQGVTYYSNQSFNIVIYYEDSNQLKAIDGAAFQYNINGQGWKSTSVNNGTIGYYVIPVNCSIFATNGTKTVEITASKNYYESQTLNYNFNVIIIEEKGKPAGEFPLVIVIIAIVSIAGGIGATLITIGILRKRKLTNKVA